MTTVTIYGRPGCGACIFTERALELGGIPLRVRDVDTEEEVASIAENMSAALGTRELPVVVCDDGQAWSGLQLERIAELVREAAEVRRAWEAEEPAEPYPWNAERHHAVLERLAC